MGTGRRWREPEALPFAPSTVKARQSGTRILPRQRTSWMGAVPPFSADAPPADWERQHARGRTQLRTATGLLVRAVNSPVPRQASCHYYATVGGPATFYFY